MAVALPPKNLFHLLWPPALPSLLKSNAKMVLPSLISAMPLPVSPFMKMAIFNMLALYLSALIILPTILPSFSKSRPKSPKTSSAVSSPDYLRMTIKRSSLKKAVKNLPLSVAMLIVSFVIVSMKSSLALPMKSSSLATLKNSPRVSSSSAVAPKCAILMFMLNPL